MTSKGGTKQKSKSNSQSGKTHTKTQKVKAKTHTGNLNENDTNEDMYKRFVIKASEYRPEASSVDSKMSEKAWKS